MKKKWLIASYKSNQVSRVQTNLSNQKFDYYLPKIKIKTNSNLKEEVLFPGYIFINTSIENYLTLKYTRGIKNIIKFGDNLSYISNEDIKSMQVLEKNSIINPITSKVQIGQKAIITKGSLRGSMVKICSLPSKKRVGVLLTFLGSMRRVIIPEENLSFDNIY